tara:strand:- start:42 stop:422 length:381 start_codon:yes stop_codon:yes gene_type:complete
MSTLKVDTIQNSSGISTSTTSDILAGRAKAWIHYDGSGTYSNLNSFNVSSLVDIGTGRATINWTSGTFTNANYCLVFGSSREPYNTTHGVMYVDSHNSSSASVRCCNDESSGTMVDKHQVSIVCFH